MTNDNFTEAAHAEAERRYNRIARRNKTAGEWLDEGQASGFTSGAEWARTHLAAQEPTDAGRRVTYIEVEAYLAAFSEDLPPDTEWTPDTIARVRRGLTAAYAARRDEEAR